jgi:hypothetical protein
MTDVEAEGVADQVVLRVRIRWEFLLVLAMVSVLPHCSEDDTAIDVPNQESSTRVLLPSMPKWQVESEENLVPGDRTLEYRTPPFEGD